MGIEVADKEKDAEDQRDNDEGPHELHGHHTDHTHKDDDHCQEGKIYSFHDMLIFISFYNNTCGICRTGAPIAGQDQQAPARQGISAFSGC